MLQVRNVLGPEGYSWDSNLPSSRCFGAGRGTEVPLGTTDFTVVPVRSLMKAQVSLQAVLGFLVRC